MGNKKALVLVVLASLFSVSAVAAEKIAVISFKAATLHVVSKKRYAASSDTSAQPGCTLQERVMK